MYGTDRGNETRARVETRANPGEKASRNQLLHCRNRRKQLTGAQRWIKASTGTLQLGTGRHIWGSGVFSKLRAHLAVMEMDLLFTVFTK